MLSRFVKEAHLSHAEGRVAEHAESIGIRSEVEGAEKERLKSKLGGETWEFDCPISRASQSVVTGLDVSALNERQTRLTWCVCVACRLVIPERAYHLADLLFEAELRSESPEILRGYGLGQDGDGGRLRPGGPGHSRSHRATSFMTGALQHDMMQELLTGRTRLV